MFAWSERRKNEKSEFRAQFTQADGSLAPLLRTGGRFFREFAACFIFTYGLAGYVLPCYTSLGAKTGR